mgnify:FL=1
MDTCPACNANTLKQSSSLLNRVIFSCYLVLFHWFFTGEFGGFFIIALALLLLVLPYKQQCNPCNQTSIRITPKWDRSGLFGMDTGLSKLLVGMLPSVLVMSSLIYFFPNTGLGRVLYLPAVLFINIMITTSCVFITKVLKRYLQRLVWVLSSVITVTIVVVMYPQEYDEHIIRQLLYIL